MREEFIRTEWLLGEENMKKLQNSRVAIFGIGGVGSYALEALARIGIGSFVLVDNDTVACSNINRQLIATHKTIGMAKVEVAKQRVESINPQAVVEIHRAFYLPENGQGFIDGCDYVVDAIDTVSAKIALVEEAKGKNIPMISCMGTGNKLNPAMLQISDLSKTSVCPLCRVMRKELKARGIQNLKVVYSEEVPMKPMSEIAKEKEQTSYKKRQTPGSVSFVPSVAGLLSASEVTKDLAFGPAPADLRSAHRAPAAGKSGR